jgi:hypothetical protein
VGGVWPLDFFDVCAPPVLSNTTFGLKRRLDVDSVDELTTGSDVTPDAEAESDVTSDAEAGSEVEATEAESEGEDDESDVEPCELDVEPCEPDVEFDEESDDEPDADDEDVEPDSDGSARATPAVFAIAAPTPSATANAPTRPMYIAVPMMVPSPVESDADSPSRAPMGRVMR